MTTTRPLEDLLHAYVDEQADAADLARLETMLQDPAHARRAALWLTHDHLLATALRRPRPATRVRRRPRIAARPSWRGGLLAASVLIAICGAFIVVTNKPGPDLPVLAIDGEPARNLTAGEVLTMSEASPMRVRWHDGSQVVLTGPGKATVGDAATGPALQMSGGMLVANVVTRPSGLPFRLTTSNGTVSVLGTTFQISDRTAASQVRVTSGTVLVATGTGPGVAVQAGTQALAIAGQMPLPVAWQAAGWEANASLPVWPVELTACAGPDGREAVRMLAPPVLNHPNEWRYTVAQHALRLPADRTTLQVNVRVESTAPGTRLNLQVIEADHEVWMLADWALDELASGWQPLRVSVLHPLKRQGWPADERYDPATVVGFIVTIFHPPATIDVTPPELLP